MDLLRRIFPPSQAGCEHIPAETPTPSGSRCDECGSTFNLRLCATSGGGGCCESQAGYASVHAAGSGHQVIYQMPAGSGFIWCYAERRYVG